MDGEGPSVESGAPCYLEVRPEAGLTGNHINSI